MIGIREKSSRNVLVGGNYSRFLNYDMNDLVVLAVQRLALTSGWGNVLDSLGLEIVDISTENAKEVVDIPAGRTK